MAGLSANLKSAEEAVAYVKRMVPLGASNVAQDVLLTGGASATCVTRLRASYPDEINNGVQSDGWIEYVASAAIGARCGNCAEQCALAIKFLKDTWVDSLDFMGFNPMFFDHQFVVIGRESGSVVNKISTWGLNAVICDPWYPTYPDPKVNRRFYPAFEAWHKMTMYLPAGEHTLQSLGRWAR